MLRLLKILWPALIPLLCYAVWHAARARKKARGEAVAPVTRPLFIAVAASMLVAVICLALLGAEQGPNEGAGYVPTHMQDGKLIQGGFR